MIPAPFAPLLSHIWQSTLFAAVAALLALALRRNQARVRYWLWLAASYKFLIPFSLLVSIGSLFRWRAAPAAMPHAVTTVTDLVSDPVFLTTDSTVQPASNHPPMLIFVLVAIWACGFVVVVARWMREWVRIRTIVRAASPLQLNLPVRVASTVARMEPGVFGIFRPVLLLPEGIADRLTPVQLQAVIAHELCHVRRRDNLTAAIHMLVEAVFWFYPVVWWLGTRIIDERERACDEEVLRAGSQAQVYAESILRVCEFYLESPLTCVSGISGSDLKKRIRRIMQKRFGAALSVRKKLLLAIAGVTILAMPIATGLLASSLRAQAPVPTSVTGQLKFDAVSIKPNNSGSGTTTTGVKLPGGHSKATNITPRLLIATAYDLPAFASHALLEGPKWIDSEHFDVEAETPGNPTVEQKRLMLQSLLADRFKLRVHHETRQLAVFDLVLAKGGKTGPQLRPHTDNAKCVDISYYQLPTSGSNDALPMPCGDLSVQVRRGGSWRLAGGDVTMQMLAKFLSYLQGVDRAVVDQTALSGNFDVRLDWTMEFGQAVSSESNPSASPDIFTALQEQLGLKLESTKGPVDVLVIDHVEQPSPN